jgi:hypothetical protein
VDTQDRPQHRGVKRDAKRSRSPRGFASELPSIAGDRRRFAILCCVIGALRRYAAQSCPGWSAEPHPFANRQTLHAHTGTYRRRPVPTLREVMTDKAFGDDPMGIGKGIAVRPLHPLWLYPISRSSGALPLLPVLRGRRSLEMQTQVSTFIGGARRERSSMRTSEGSTIRGRRSPAIRAVESARTQPRSPARVRVTTCTLSHQSPRRKIQPALPLPCGKPAVRRRVALRQREQMFIINSIAAVQIDQSISTRSPIVFVSHPPGFVMRAMIGGEIFVGHLALM